MRRRWRRVRGTHGVGPSDAGGSQLIVEQSCRTGGANDADAEEDGEGRVEGAAVAITRRDAVFLATTETNGYAGPHIVGAGRCNAV